MNNNQKVSAIMFLLTIVIVFSIFSWNYSKAKNTSQNTTPIAASSPNSTTATQSPTATPTISTNDWKTLENTGHSFMYPDQAKADARKEESVVTFMGQKQIDSGRTQTELFDGYSFRVGPIVPEPEATLEQVAKQEQQNAVANCLRETGKISQVKQITVNNQTAYQFSGQGCNLDFTETIIANNTTIYRITQAYVGDVTDQEKYREITDQMLMSFKFIK
jgi:hypothetical protein